MCWCSLYLLSLLTLASIAACTVRSTGVLHAFSFAPNFARHGSIAAFIPHRWTHPHFILHLARPATCRAHRVPKVVEVHSSPRALRHYCAAAAAVVVKGFFIGQSPASRERTECLIDMPGKVTTKVDHILLWLKFKVSWLTFPSLCFVKPQFHPRQNPRHQGYLSHCYAVTREASLPIN